MLDNIWHTILQWRQLCLFVGQLDVVIEPSVIKGSLGDFVNITCIVGNEEPQSTQLLTDNNQLLDNAQLIDIQDSNRLIYIYGPLSIDDNERIVICRYGTIEAHGTIIVLCKYIILL